jgi:hypothetical protein
MDIKKVKTSAKEWKSHDFLKQPKKFRELDKEKLNKMRKELGYGKKTSKTVYAHGYYINPKKQYKVVINDYFAEQSGETGDEAVGVEYGKVETYDGADVIKLLDYYSIKLKHPYFDFEVEEAA